MVLAAVQNVVREFFLPVPFLFLLFLFPFPLIPIPAPTGSPIPFLAHPILFLILYYSFSYLISFIALPKQKTYDGIGIFSPK
jgi:hypothetical protein